VVGSVDVVEDDMVEIWIGTVAVVMIVVVMGAGMVTVGILATLSMAAITLSERVCAMIT
jgi:hypothetical protein